MRLLHRLQRLLERFIDLPRMLLEPGLRGRPEHGTIISWATYAPWRVDESFRTWMEIVGDASMNDESRLYELWRLARQTASLSGDAIEVGCWRGGGGCLIAAALDEAAIPGRTYLCDTFTGVVKAGSNDSVYRGGEHGDADAASVHRLIEQSGLARVEVLDGIFPDTTGELVAERSFRFVHLDVDVYAGTRDAFSYLRTRLVPGAIVVIDDYGSTNTDGIRRFVDELEGDPDFAVVHNVNGQAVLVHRGAAGPSPT